MELTHNIPPSNIAEALGIDIDKSPESVDLSSLDLDELISKQNKTIAGNMQLMQECAAESISAYEKTKEIISAKRTKLTAEIWDLDCKYKAINLEISKLRESVGFAIGTATNGAAEQANSSAEQPKLLNSVGVKFNKKKNTPSWVQRELVLQTFLRRPDHDSSEDFTIVDFPSPAGKNIEALVLYPAQIINRIKEGIPLNSYTGLPFEDKYIPIGNTYMSNWINRLWIDEYVVKYTGPLKRTSEQKRSIKSYWKLTDRGFEEVIGMMQRISKINAFAPKLLTKH